MMKNIGFICIFPNGTEMNNTLRYIVIHIANFYNEKEVYSWERGIKMERLFEILKTLNSIQGFVSIHELAQEFSVTERTIRSDIAMLEELLEKKNIKLEKQRTKGIRLDKMQMDEKHMLELLSELTGEKNFYSYEERENIILEMLLLEEEHITMKKLEDLTLSSKASVAKNLTDCERKLEKYQIFLSRRSRIGITVLYREYQWRMAVTEQIMQYVRKMDFQQLYDSLFHNCTGKLLLSANKFIACFVYNMNTTYIVNFIQRYEANHKIKFTDESKISIYFYICVAITRAREGHALKQDDFALNQFFHIRKIDDWLYENTEFLNKGLGENLNRFELEAILVYLLTQRQSSEIGELQQEFLLTDEQFNKKASSIARKFICRAQDYLNVNLSGDERLFENLLLHIRPTIFRLLFGIRLTNPIKEDIIINYPAIFAACKEAAREISDATHTLLDDNEISYLALHVGASVEKARKKQFSGIYKTLVICPGGKGTSSILYYRLLNSVPNIQIEHICSIGDLNRINKEDIDLLISTVPIYMGQNSNVIEVNPLLKNEDIAKIRRAIKRINLTKNDSGKLVVEDIMSIVSNFAFIRDYNGLYRSIDNYFNQPIPKNTGAQKTIGTFLRPAQIMLSQEIKTWREAFEIAGTLLYKAGMIEKRYINCMISNAEKYGTYMLICERVALAHASTTDGVYKTGFSFVTLRQPVMFQHGGEEHSVQFVIALSAEDNMTHLTALGELIDCVCQPDKLEEILKICDVSQFVGFLEENCRSI